MEKQAYEEKLKHRLPLSRNGPDDFQTPPEAVLPLLPYLPLDWTIWECACGKGYLTKALGQAGRKVIGTDIKTGRDFLSWQPNDWQCEVSNPPYSLKNEFLERAYALGKPFAFLMPVTTVESQSRQRLFRDNGIQVMVLNKRIHFETPNQRPSHAWFPVAWFCWRLNLPQQLMFADDRISLAAREDSVRAVKPNSSVDAPISRYVNKVYHGDALRLLRVLPSVSVDAIIADPMYMAAKVKGKNCMYDWGIEPGCGNPEEWWDYHRGIYEECLRVLRPGGSLAWVTVGKFKPHFQRWFKGHRIWAFSRFLFQGVRSYDHIWVVQTKEQQPIRFPDDDALLLIGPRGWWRTYHPCPKSEEEMQFLVKHLTQPGQIVLDPFSGTGTTLVAAQQLGRQWIGGDISRRYCQVAMKRIAAVKDVSSTRSSRATDGSAETNGNGPRMRPV